jgi:thioesterase domain-containing protein/acyl carrier protein
VTREGRRGEGRLIAFVVPVAGHRLSAGDTRAALGRRLPSYMVPSTVSVIDELPLGANGKVDRSALPDATERTEARRAADDLERLIARVWEDVLEVHAVDVDDDFFALGGDSLAAAEVMACLEHETGTSLSVSVLAGSPTVAGLADALRTEPRSAQPGLVVLRPAGGRAPLALAHGITGDLLHFAKLVPILDRDRPVLGLERLEVDATSVGEIAAHHVRSLVAVNPSGPFLLVGFCSGAVVAHEVACQLRDAGHEVSLLALLGFSPRDFPNLRPSAVGDRWRKPSSAESRLLPLTRYHLRVARTLPARERPRYLLARASNLRSRAGARIGRRGSVDSWPHEVVERAFSAHDPGVYPGKALVILHEDDTALYTDDPVHSWAALAEQIDVTVLPGRGHAMLEEPGSVRLAALVNEHLSSIP